jgi:hypothetical protein
MSADLVKIVSQTMPEASIEQVLDEVRRITVRSVAETVRQKNMKGPMEILEHVIKTYDFTLEDTKAVVDQAGFPDMADSPLFEAAYTYLSDKKPSCRCFPWKG